MASGILTQATPGMLVDAAAAQRVADDGEGATGMPDLLSGEDVCGGEEDAHTALIHCDEPLQLYLPLRCLPPPFLPHPPSPPPPPPPD